MESSENLSRYRCLFGRMHVITGARLIGWLYVMVSLAQIFAHLILMAKNQVSIPGSTSCFYGGISIIAAVRLCYGLDKRKPDLIISHIVVQCMGIGLLVVMAIMYGVALSVNSSSVLPTFMGYRELIQNSAGWHYFYQICLTAVCAFCLLIMCKVYCVYICLKAYQYVVAKQLVQLATVVVKNIES